MLDKVHDGNFESDPGDDFQYIGGEINDHKIIIATFPPGMQFGGNSAAALANQIRKCIGGSLWFSLLVGIAAGLPDLSGNPPKDIRLGDVLISLPEKESSGVVQHDMVKQTTEGLENQSQQQMTIPILRATFGHIRTMARLKGNVFLRHLERVKDILDDKGLFLFQDIGQENDVLTVRSEEVLEQRQPRNEPRTRTWYGVIGSGNTLMKSWQESLSGSR